MLYQVKSKNLQPPCTWFIVTRCTVFVRIVHRVHQFFICFCPWLISAFYLVLSVANISFYFIWFCSWLITEHTASFRRQNVDIMSVAFGINPRCGNEILYDKPIM